MFVPVIDEALDLATQVSDGAEGSAADGVLRNVPEPTLNLVEPGGIDRSVADMEARTTREPAPDLDVFVSPVVIDNKVDIQVFGHAGFDVAQKTQELLMPMSQLALSEDLAVGDVERRKQRGRAVANVVVCDAFEVTESHRHHGLRAPKGLNLALLINTQHQRIARWIQIQTNHITHLLDEERIGGELEGL